VADGCIELLKRLRLLPDGQTRHGLVRHCLDACKVMYLLRSTAFSSARDAATRLSAALRQTVTDLVGCPLTDAAWAQATLPIAYQGIGIRDPLEEWAPARIASLVHFHRSATVAVGLPEATRRVLAPDTSDTIAALQRTLDPQHDPLGRWSTDPTAIRLADEQYARQLWWAGQVAVARRDELPWKGTARDHVRLASSVGPLAGEWLGVCPSANLGTTIPDGDFRSLCRWWLGLALLPESPATLKCPLCGAASDIYGDHFVSCQKNGLSARHNTLRDAWSSVLTQAGVSHVKEVATLRRDRPADILLRHWDKGRHVAVDFVVTHPLAASSTVRDGEGARRLLRAAEASKVQLEEASCSTMGWGLHPAAYSPWGGQGPAAASLLFETTRRLAAECGAWSRKSRVREARQGLSLALARAVATQLSVRSRALESSTGEAEVVADSAPLLTLFPWWN
jgi:hypothetical protein